MRDRVLQQAAREMRYASKPRFQEARRRPARFLADAARYDVLARAIEFVQPRLELRGGQMDTLRRRCQHDFVRLANVAQLDAKLAALTVEQVNAAFRKHVDPSAISIVKAGDFKAADVYQQ